MKTATIELQDFMLACDTDCILRAKEALEDGEVLEVLGYTEQDEVEGLYHEVLTFLDSGIKIIL